MKLKEYLDKYGIKHKFFAEQMNIHQKSFSNYLVEAMRIPEKYWKKIVEKTEGEVTIIDLFESGPDPDAADRSPYLYKKLKARTGKHSE